jgi:hypothetical protein
MYLLTIAGDKIRAIHVGEEYLDFIEKKEGKEKRVHIGIQFDKYLNWLDQALNSN